MITVKVENETIESIIKLILVYLENFNDISLLINGNNEGKITAIDKESMSVTQYCSTVNGKDQYINKIRSLTKIAFLNLRKRNNDIELIIN